MLRSGSRGKFLACTRLPKCKSPQSVGEDGKPLESKPTGINCDKCVPDCPNDANFVYETGPLALDYRNYRVGGGKVEEVAGGRFEVGKVHQIANFQDFCNECGNCDTFCPERGAPWQIKPRLYTSVAAWEERGRDGWLLGSPSAPGAAVDEPESTAADLARSAGWLMGE